jgi:DNA (cytosine-5)-methyltransferase 1
MGDVLADLAGLGYDAEWDCVPACFVGAPHIRNRVWIVAYPQRGELRVEPGRRNGQDRPGTAVAGDDGTSRAMAVADGWGFAEQPQRDGEPQPRIFTSLGHDTERRDPHVADAERPGSQGRTRRAMPGERRPSILAPASSQGHRRHWAAEPGVGRVAHGIPARVDRLRGLGNAVVPQVAEHIGRLIMNAAA